MDAAWITPHWPTYHS